MYNIWFWVIIGILSFNFLLGLWLNFLNASSLSEDLPDEVSDIYEAEKYAKSQKYTRENIRFSLITKTFSFIVIMLMLFFKGFAFFDELAVKLVGEGVIKTALVFFLLLYLINEVISLPFDIYDTFVIEKKYGFNKTTRSVFIGDKIVTDVIGGNRFGSLTILVDPLYPLPDKWYTIIMHNIEKVITWIVGFKRGKYYE